MEWAGRTADDRPPLCALVDTVGWTIDCQNVEATFTRATDRLLFGDGVARLSYRSLGGPDKPRVFVRPPTPIPIAVVTTYSDGTMIAANGSAEEPLECVWDGRPLSLPPNGFAGVSGDRRVRVWNGIKDGHRAEFAVAPDYTYLNGRGVFTVFPEGGTDGICVRLPLADGTEDVVTCGATRIELPYAARRIEVLDEAGHAIRELPVRTENDRTVIIPSPDAPCPIV